MIKLIFKHFPEIEKCWNFSYAETENNLLFKNRKLV